MSPVSIGGRQLGVAQNGVFNEANTDPIPGGRLWPEAALTWNAMHAAYVARGGSPREFVPGGPNSSARTVGAQRMFYSQQPPPAAYPGTSNHGWGIAVDVGTRAAAAWILRNGARYGWSHDEGARVGEWWHFRYVGAPAGVVRRLQRDPLAGYTRHERRWIKEYDRLVGSGRDPHRVRVLRLVMALQRKRIWKAAQDGRGWTRLRRRRYAALRART